MSSELSVETSVATMLEKSRVKLSGIVPDMEFWYKAELACDINRLKKEEKNAVIESNHYVIEVSEDVRTRAAKAVAPMLEIR